MWSYIFTCTIPSNSHIKRSHIFQTCRVTQSHEAYKKTVTSSTKITAVLICRTELFCYWFASSSSPSSSLLLGMKTEVSKSKLCKQKRPLPSIVMLWPQCFTPVVRRQRLFSVFTSKVERGRKLLPRFMDHPIKLARPLVPCSGLTASINKVPINNNIVRQVKARISCHTRTSWRLLARLRTKVLQHCLSLSRHGVNTGYATPRGCSWQLTRTVKDYVKL